MIKAQVKNLTGKKVEEIELDSKVFDLEINDTLIHQVYTSQYANRRQVIAHTKDRGERQGSGKKPWKQKGTGRARTGSVRNPIWRKGGITFGPTNDRNFKKKINKKMKKIATAMVLSGKLKDKELIIIDKFDYKDNKTKEARKLLEGNKLKGTVLWAYSVKDNAKKKASRNLTDCKNINAEDLAVFDMLNNRYLVIEKEEVKKVEKRLLNR